MSSVDFSQYKLIAEPSLGLEDPFRRVHLLPAGGIHLVEAGCWCHPERLEDDYPFVNCDDPFIAFIHQPYAAKWG